jgi:Tfp pilus assembly protein PilP
MKLTDDAAKQDLDDALDRVRELKAAMLESAKAEAKRRGKEPFNLEKLEELCDTSHKRRLAPHEERYAEFERKYYVRYPDTMTLVEFCERDRRAKSLVEVTATQTRH